MASYLVKFLRKHPVSRFICVRSKVTSSQYVASRARDPTFEKLMKNYKNLLKVIAIQDLILANPKKQSVSVEFLSRLSQKLHLNRGATAFLRKHPHIFHIFYEPSKSQPFCKFTDAALDISHQEAIAINASLPVVVDRLVRILSMSASKTLCDAHEPNTHLLKLVDVLPDNHFTAAVENWRVVECCKEDCKLDRTEMQFSFKHAYPPGMRLSKSYKAKVKKWQSLPYLGPYEMMGEKKKSKAGMMALEKRAVSVVHEFLSLTVEKMIEVEKISQFRKWFGIDLNIRDLFVDHPGIFYLSTKGKRHTVFLREAYERGCLIEPNPVYEARRRLLDLVVLGRRGLPAVNSKYQDPMPVQARRWFISEECMAIKVKDLSWSGRLVATTLVQELLQRRIDNHSVLSPLVTISWILLLR
ncbi:hypothetical protein K1719_024279 [Acacia pycnantha]|nr:hypothetical protein K1719_024279 [Acacia pycnantha]